MTDAKNTSSGGPVDLTLNAKLAPLKRRFRAAVADRNDQEMTEAYDALVAASGGERRWLDRRGGALFNIGWPAHECRRKFDRREDDRDGE